MPSAIPTSDSDNNIADYQHAEQTRKNIPLAGMPVRNKVKAQPKHRYEYDPHLPPVLRFDTSESASNADRLPELLQIAQQRALNAEEVKLISRALRNREPWLEWAGKRETKAAEVDPVALHIHERVSAQAILKVAARQDVTRSLFADPEQEYRESVEFYKHDVAWANRLILGDSLEVMASLAKREDLAGKVQCIYMDPPYGIKYGSNFQSEVGKRDVKDKPEDLTREPEMVKAYRDTWNLGVHSYLAYLRDRLYASKDLLSDSGSIFVQISEENIHRVRLVMDEVFGPNNFVSQISYATTGGFETGALSRLGDYLLWYARDKCQLKYNQVFLEKNANTLKSGDYRYINTLSGERRLLTVEERDGIIPLPEEARIFRFDNVTSQDSSKEPQPFHFEGKTHQPRAGRHWTVQWPDGMDRLSKAGRLQSREGSLACLRFLDDYPVFELTNMWGDTSVAGTKEGKVYVVQTNPKVVERCLLMTTDPGDIVIDPTCGSGTTAYVAEQWGRRWITVDSSRVALAIARQRLMTAKFDYYPLRAPDKGVSGGFIYKTVPHITLKSIAQNVALDPLFAKWEAVLT